MKPRLFKSILVLVAILFLAMTSFAAESKTIDVTAAIDSVSGGLEVTVSKIDADTDEWLQHGSSLPIDFGTLTLDTVNHIFTAAYYYAVDIGVNDNTGTVWTVTHTRTDLKKDAANNLNNNVNVTFMKQTTANPAGEELSNVSYANSNNVAYTKTDLSGGWLRIYYGIADGSDATGVVPIGTDKPAGTYSGSVTITLTP